MTTMMQQYRDAKERHPDMLLLFRVGDFYELYDADAELVSSVIGWASRDWTPIKGGIRIAEASLEGNLRKLLQAGHRVAICEPVAEAPKAAKVERVVSRDGAWRPGDVPAY